MQRNTHTVFFHLNPKNKTNVNECNKTGTETDRYREHTSSYQRGKGMARGEKQGKGIKRYKLLDIK